MKAGYGEPLRRFFAEKSWVESVVDFGHAKQIFEDADVFPSIIVVRRPHESVSRRKPACVRFREMQLRIDDLSVQIAREGAEVERNSLNEKGGPSNQSRLIACSKKSVAVACRSPNISALNP